MKYYTLLITLVISVSLSTIMSAEEIKIPVGQQGEKALVLPSNGDTQSKVIEQFGEPEKESTPVGNPPITKWHYENFIVVFENDRVITSVKKVQSD